MARTPTTKELVNTRLASGHGGWIYCDSCGQNIGYLCYVTYDSIHFSYQCNCGTQGSLHLAFEAPAAPHQSDRELVTIKNRLCCPQDSAPLFTILYSKLACYRYRVVCTKCGTAYTAEKPL